MSEPDMILGPGDTAPIHIVTLLLPDDQDGNPGDPMDLTGATVTCRNQLRNGSGTVAERVVSIMQTAPTVNRGMVAIDWSVSPGVPAAGADYFVRLKVIDAGGRQSSFPNGPDRVLPDGTNPAFLWLQVSRDFPAP